jgi:hypothetical protein
VVECLRNLFRRNVGRCHYDHRAPIEGPHCRRLVLLTLTQNTSA